jgi:glycosyltransferase involved in cell wall biosynthesis
MRVAIVHYWLIDRRGGERVVEALCRLYPQADVFTNVLNAEAFQPLLANHVIRTTFIDKLPLRHRMLDAYLPLMPLALDQLDLRDYDLVISSESGPAKGIVVRPDAIHICYCHSPMRYVWDMAADYRREVGPLRRLLMGPALHYLRMWDVLSAQRPDAIIANSEHTRLRVRKYWKRDATVLHPPVDIHRFRQAASEVAPGDYFLSAGQLMSYKRVDLAVAAFTQLKLPLLVAGTGPQFGALRRQAGPTIRFTGALTEEEFARTVAGCRALVFPGEEDFGIVPVEAMAAGRPVIAYGRGGAVDSIIDGVTGLFFETQSTEALGSAIQRFVNIHRGFESGAIMKHADRFDGAHFRSRFEELANRIIAEHRTAKAAG